MTGATSPSSVFVAYPWSPYARDDYKSRYRRLERKHGVAFGFAEDRLTSEHLIAKIEAMMTAADFCIFDLTALSITSLASPPLAARARQLRASPVRL